MAETRSADTRHNQNGAPDEAASGKPITGGEAHPTGEVRTEPPSLAELQHWTQVMGRAQQMMLQAALDWMKPGDAGESPTADPASATASGPDAKMSAESGWSPFGDPMGWFEAGNRIWAQEIDLWREWTEQGWAALGGAAASGASADGKPTPRDKRFDAPEWQAWPAFDLIRRSYLFAADRLLAATEALPVQDEKQRAQLRFASRNFIDAMSPTNFAATNPVIWQKTIETGGENLLRGLDHMIRDLQKGQLTHTDSDAFEIGRNIATTPGKVVHETELYQLIQYTPTTEQVLSVPIVIFPPWINRFYILDLNPQKSFVRWALDQGISVFMVSWRSADESMRDVIWDDYVNAEIDAVDTICEILGVPSVHTIGYCVAGTTLAAALAVLTVRGQAQKVHSATFFTAQVDFSEAGDLSLFVDDNHLRMIEAASAPGYLDGRYMAATFNLLRGRDLIWNYVVNNYLLGEDYPPFDLLHWNGDTTNLPAKWHKSYLTDLYRDNRLVQPDSLSVDGIPIDLRVVRTPAYIQAGREDHIAPPASVWKITRQFSGPLRFVLAGSGHIAGVVNPPAAGKYQYWTNDAPVDSFEAFVAGATEHKGSWWPDWFEWLSTAAPQRVDAKGARVPGHGSRSAIEEAPGRFVRMR